ncbi:MAG: DUF1801 domain-containing protein [Saprospiraceae bacterium]|nr:DUF1801 domain-containing protein [Saprospiraceae bacterium]
MDPIYDMPRELFGFLLDYPEDVRDLFESVRKVILDKAPNGYELIWDNYNALAVAYSSTDKLRDAYCHIAAYGSYVNLGFNQGVHLRDPHHLLQGDGKLIRHIKISSLEDLRQQGVSKLVYEAIQWSKQLNPLTKKMEGTQSIVMSVSEKRRRPSL